MASTYRVQAYNTATASENKIHDDTVARRFGFRGGLVPGVDVYAYMTHPAVERWRRAWLERGAMSARFLHPVYDGEAVEVICQVSDVEQAIGLEVRNAEGTVCATGRAVLPDRSIPSPPLADFPRAPLSDTPPPAAPQALAPGRLLGTVDVEFRAEWVGEYLDDIRESLPIYREHGIAHPGYLLRGANYVLAANVTLGPWLHVGSEVQHHSVATDGDRGSVRARVVDLYERKGHKFADLDVLMVANDDRPLARVRHTAIYEPRQARP